MARETTKQATGGPLMGGGDWTRRDVLKSSAGLAAVGLLPVGLARAEAAPVRTVAFGSCLSQREPAPILDAVVAAQPDLTILMGDNVYGDDTPENQGLNILRAAYAQQDSQPGFQRLRAAAPILPTWDDHDFGLNDAGAEFPYKDLAQELFNDFWQVPEGDARRNRAGVYHAQTFGPEGARVQVILLDTRYFRAPLERAPSAAKVRYVEVREPGRTMLGEAQWTWFEEQLAQPADIRLIVSSIQVIAMGHGWEKWGNFLHERDRFFRTIRASGATGVVLLSGDRHSAGLYRIRDRADYPLYEATSSSLNLAFLRERGVQEFGPNRLHGMYAGENFGTVSFDWDARQLALTVHGIDGAPVFVQPVAFAEIGVPG